jgi:hypothetical protein
MVPDEVFQGKQVIETGAVPIQTYNGWHPEDGDQSIVSQDQHFVLPEELVADDG